MRTVAVALAALVAVASASMSTISTYGGCKWTWHDPTLLGSQQASATYDVSALTVPESSAYAYRAHDPHNEQENQDRYEYTFNVCGDVPSSAVPDPNNCPAGRTAAYRTMLAPTDDDAITDDAQPMEEGEAGVGISDACKPLTPAIGGRYAKQSVAYAALHDSDRPAHGFTIAYPAYSATLKCKTPPSDPNKTANYLQFRHVFICEDFATPTAQQTNSEYNRTLVLSEDDAQGCFIDVYMFGHAGCPQECPIVNGKVCGGNGICDYDENIHKARCFCNDDFIESDCQTPLDPSPTGGIVGAVFGGLIIGAAIVGAFWYFRMRNAGPGSAAGSAPADGYYEAAEG